MPNSTRSSLRKQFTSRQIAFKELFVGTLLYAVILGFLGDYTDFVTVGTFSTIFLASIVLEILTYLTFMLKAAVLRRYRQRYGQLKILTTILLIWPIMFVSKFVFVWFIDVLFSGSIDIQGFWGILIVVVSVTVVHKLADAVFVQLGRD
jgi:amino acid transporter